MKKRLLEKLALMLICAVAFSYTEFSPMPVIALLSALSVSAAVSAVSGHLSAKILIFLFSMACLPMPAAFCAAPLILYDAFWERSPYLALPMLLALRSGESIRSEQLLIVSVGCAVAAIMYFRIDSMEKIIKAMSSQRDEVAVSNVRLTDRNARLLEAQDNELRLATLRERNRIAREIHDNVGHMLTRSLLQSGALIVINKDEALREPLEELKETLNTAMTSIRESVHDLHDESIDLEAVVKESIASVSDRFKVVFENDCSEPPVRIRLCFLSVIKEALSNCVKHSNGDKITIIIREHPGLYQLMIEDNGSGPSGKEKTSDGIGLQNMRDRVEALNGIISFTHSESGFRIFSSIPKKVKGETEK